MKTLHIIFAFILPPAFLLPAQAEIKKIYADVATEEAQINTQATPVKRVEPKYPIEAARKSREGWVKLSFVVDEEGRVDNILVVDSSGHADFEREARKAAKRWRYDPAVENGQPIVQCDNAVQFSFRLNGDYKGARRKFITKFKKASALLDENKLADARLVIDDIIDDTLWNYYENAWHLLLESRYASLNGDHQQAYIHHKGMTDKWARSLLPEDVYLGAVERAYLYELNNLLLADANKSYQLFTELESAKTLVDIYADEQQQVAEFIGNDKLLLIKGSIGKRDFWHHTLARKDFSLANVEGKLSKVEIRCDKQHQEFDFAPDRTWDIPDSWGECLVFVHGEQGSRFELLELPFEKS